MKSFIFILMCLFMFMGIAYADSGTDKKLGPKIEKVTIDNLISADAPSTSGQALDKGKEVIEYAKVKKWFSMSAGIIWLLMFVLKIARKNVSFMQNMNKRWLYIAVSILSIAAMMLARFQGELSWTTAFTVLFSGPSVAYLNDLFKRGIFGRVPSS